MIKNVLVPINCGEETCQENVYTECGNIIRKPLFKEYYCTLFNVKLSYETKHNAGNMYSEIKRCEQCRQAEQI
jgi:hypothetical protein